MRCFTHADAQRTLLTYAGDGSNGFVSVSRRNLTFRPDRPPPRRGFRHTCLSSDPAHFIPRARVQPLHRDCSKESDTSLRPVLCFIFSTCCSLKVFLEPVFVLFLSSDSEVIYRNSDGHVIKFNILTNETEIILTNSTFVSALPAVLFQNKPLKLDVWGFFVLTVFLPFRSPLDKLQRGQVLRLA